MDEMEKVLSYPRTDEPSDRAYSLARGLYGRLALLCREKDDEEDGTYFLDICIGHTNMIINLFAKHYQTLLDNGDVE